MIEEGDSQWSSTATVLFEPAEEGGFMVTCPALPGLLTAGDTLEEARAMAQDAIRAYLESLRRPALKPKAEAPTQQATAGHASLAWPGPEARHPEVANWRSLLAPLGITWPVSLQRRFAALGKSKLYTIHSMCYCELFAHPLTYPLGNDERWV
jgi:antitoxin HicB